VGVGWDDGVGLGKAVAVGEIVLVGCSTALGVAVGIAVAVATNAGVIGARVGVGVAIAIGNRLNRVGKGVELGDKATEYGVLVGFPIVGVPTGVAVTSRAPVSVGIMTGVDMAQATVQTENNANPAMTLFI